MVVVRVAQGHETLMLKEDSYDNRVSNTNISEWRVKVVGSQSCMRLGEACCNIRKDVGEGMLGQEVYSGRIVSSDLSPHWSNMVEG